MVELILLYYNKKFYYILKINNFLFLAESLKNKLINDMSSVKYHRTPEAQSQYLELEKRLNRAKELKIVIDKLQLKKNLALSKRNELKPKLIKKGSKKTAAVYQWKIERKK